MTVPPHEDVKGIFPWNSRSGNRVLHSVELSEREEARVCSSPWVGVLPSFFRHPYSVAYDEIETHTSSCVQSYIKRLSLNRYPCWLRRTRSSVRTMQTSIKIRKTGEERRRERYTVQVSRFYNRDPRIWTIYSRTRKHLHPREEASRGLSEDESKKDREADHRPCRSGKT